MSTNEPYYKHHVFVCTNKRPDGHERGSCIDCGGGVLRTYLKNRCKELGVEGVRINASGCLDRCEDGAVAVVYPQGVWYHMDSTDDAEDIIQQHLLGGGVVERLKV